MLAATTVAAGVLGIAALIGVLGPAFGECRGAPGPDATVSAAEFGPEQVAHAAVIMAAGRDLGLPVRDQAIAVMTAMGESSLQNLAYGDWETSGVRNPDGSPTTSIGLFQQQDEWGAREDRMDPYTAATLFYEAMLEDVPDPERGTLAPPEVAHRTQVNDDPEHYAPYWPAAVDVVEDVLQADTGLDPSAGAGPGC